MSNEARKFTDDEIQAALDEAVAMGQLVRIVDERTGEVYYQDPRALDEEKKQSPKQ